MTTARQRYEQKTRVISFRVQSEESDCIEEVKTQSGLSNADLIKLGAGIARDEIKNKLAEASGLECRLAELSSSLEQEQQRLNEFLDTERRRRLELLEVQMRAFRLFDRRWSVEEASFELGIPQAKAFHYFYFQEWAKERKDKQAAERELLRACLKKHIERLKERISWARFFPSTPKERLEELEGEIDYCQYLLSAPSKINKEWREFLIAEYSSKV